MKKRIVYLFVFLILILFFVSACKEKDIIIDNNSSEICEYVIDQKNLTNVTFCDTQEYFIEDESKKVYFLTIWYELCKQPICTGRNLCPDIECRAFHTYILEDSTIIDFPEFREDMLGMTIRNQIGPNCIIGNDLSYYAKKGRDYYLDLVKVNDEYKWKVSFLKEGRPYCMLEGYALIDEDDYDFSGITAKNLEIDCNNKTVAEDMCLIKQGSQGGNCDSLKDLNNACLYMKADSEKKLEICNMINKDEELIDLCYYTLALKLKDINICYLRNWSDYYDLNCEELIKNE